MIAYLAFTFIIIVSYGTIILLFSIGWSKIKDFKEGQHVPPNIFISLVVAAKNEEKNIPQLLGSLNAQTLDKNKFEIILVNDNSNDKTLELAESYKTELSNLKVINQVDKKGKKQAVQLGIKKSKGELIVTSDADCTHHPKWLETIVAYYNTHKPKLIIAPVLMKTNNVFEKMQSLDFFSLVASGAGASGIQQAIMCNGANLAFEKDAYLSFNDPHNTSFSSGDDVFLLLKIKKENPSGIHFLRSKKATVITKPEKTFAQFIRQRQRWASKSTGYKDAAIITVSIVVLLANLFLLTSFVIGLIWSKLLLLFLTQLAIKSIVDFIFLFKVGNYFKTNRLLLYFLPTQLANIFLVPILAFLGVFGRAKWK